MNSSKDRIQKLKNKIKDYNEDSKCTLVAVKKHGPMTLREIAMRHNISVVRAKQILDSTLDKIKNVVTLTSY